MGWWVWFILLLNSRHADAKLTDWGRNVHKVFSQYVPSTFFDPLRLRSKKVGRLFTSQCDGLAESGITCREGGFFVVFFFVFSGKNTKSPEESGQTVFGLVSTRKQRLIEWWQEIHITLFLIQKRTGGNYIPRTVNQKQEELFKSWKFLSKETHEDSKDALVPFLHQPTAAFNPFISSPAHTCPFVRLHPFPGQRHLWWHHDTAPSPHFQLRALWLLMGVKPNPP